MRVVDGQALQDARVVRDDEQRAVAFGAVKLHSARYDGKRIDVQSRVGFVKHCQFRAQKEQLQHLDLFLLAAGKPDAKLAVEIRGIHVQRLGKLLRRFAEFLVLHLVAVAFRHRTQELAETLDMDPAYLDRELGVGFSGGEKKKVEMMQLLLLQPKLAILDETDSGLDVDALSVVSRGMELYRGTCDGTLLIITHNTRILEHLNVDRVHVMVQGRVVAEGSADLIAEIDANGFERYEAQLDA